MAETAKLRLIVDADTRNAEDATRRLAGGMDKVEKESKDAAKAVDKLEKETDQLGKEAKQTTKELDKQKKATSGLTSSMKGAVAGFAAGLVSVQAFKSILISSVQASFEHERAMRATAFALENTGEIANISVKHMDAWAESLQQATGVSSDFILRATNLALTMGATTDRAKQMTTAALDFAAATGRDANQAVLQLVKTLGGYAGELAEVLPQVKQLTASQLKTGEAAVIMADLVGGAAADMRKTAAGEFQVIMSDLEDLKQAIGNVAVELVPESTGGESIFQRWAKDIEDFKRGLQELSDEGTPPVVATLMALSGTRVDITGRGRGARQREEGEAGAEAIRRAQLDSPVFAQPPTIDFSIKDPRLEAIKDELKLLKSREGDPVGIFRELARAYSPEEAFKLAAVTKTLTEAIALRTQAEHRAKDAAEGLVYAGPTQADFDLQKKFDEFDAQFMDFAGVEQTEELTKAYEKKHASEMKDIADAEARQIASFERQRAAIESLGTTVASVFINGIRDAQNFGDVLHNVFNSVLDALAAKAAAQFGLSLASSLISFIPGVGPAAAVAVRAAPEIMGTDTSMASDGEPVLTEKQAQRAIARWVLREQRVADARGL